MCIMAAACWFFELTYAFHTIKVPCNRARGAKDSINSQSTILVSAPRNTSDRIKAIPKLRSPVMRTSKWNTTNFAKIALQIPIIRINTENVENYFQIAAYELCLIDLNWWYKKKNGRSACRKLHWRRCIRSGRRKAWIDSKGIHHRKMNSISFSTASMSIQMWCMGPQKYSHRWQRKLAAEKQSSLGLGQNFLNETILHSWPVQCRIYYMSASRRFRWVLFFSFFLKKSHEQQKEKSLRKKEEEEERRKHQTLCTPPNPAVYILSLSLSLLAVCCACRMRVRSPFVVHVVRAKSFHEWMSTRHTPIPDVYRLARATYTFLSFFASFFRFSFVWHYIHIHVNTSS